MSDSIFLTDGNGTITGLVDTAYAGELIIPEYVAGERITGIGENAFFRCYSLTSIVIPDSVTSIGDTAFAECDSLTSIIIPDSVASIGYGAFLRCADLTSVDIPNSITSVSEAAFGRCTSLTSVAIPNSVTSIGDTAFAFCTSLTSVVIPNSITSVGEAAFGGCTSLTTVYVDDPDNLSPAVSSYDWSTTGSPSVTFVSIDELYRVSRLVINKLTLNQYKTAKSEGKVAEDEVYVPTDIDEVIDAMSSDISGAAKMFENVCQVLYGGPDDDIWLDDYNIGIYQDVSCPDLLSTDTPVVDVQLSGSWWDWEAYLAAWACVQRIVAYDGYLRICVGETTPEVAFNIIVKVVR